MSKTTELKCAWHDKDCIVLVKRRDDGATTIDLAGNWEGSELAAVSTADLLAALDAVPKAELECEPAFKAGYAAAIQQRDAEESRAETAEAKAASHVAQIHALEEKLAKAKGDFRDQVEKRKAAEGKLERVREFIAPCDPFRDAVSLAGLRRILDPEPFVLPTEVPARIEATDRIGATITLTLWKNGKHDLWSDDEAFYAPDQVMDGRFTGHRILGGGE